jgi:hypothetical protein
MASQKEKGSKRFILLKKKTPKKHYKQNTLDTTNTQYIINTTVC